MARSREDPKVWAYAAGYFAAYVPYAFLTRALADGRLVANGALAGLAILPIATTTSAIGMIVFLAATGWWRRVRLLRVGPLRLPLPRALAVLSGICTAAIVLTTTLAYTFEDASIVLMMLAMRGGVLVVAPLVDLWSRRRVRWFSWLALAISLAALATVAPFGGADLGLAPAIDIAIYLLAYVVRLRLMSHAAKGEEQANQRFFVEEQLVATPVAVVVIAGLALANAGSIGVGLAEGFALADDLSTVPWIVLVGLCSQGTGIFGALVLLDARENTYSVPVNRASSVLAGVVAALALWVVLGAAAPDAGELAGAGLLLLAVLVLWAGPLFGKRRAVISANGDA
jgi:hypothetical protein